MLIALSGIAFTLILKERLAQGLGVLSLSLLPFLCTAFMIKTDIEPYVSSFEVSQYLPHATSAKTVILCSKPYARGVRYYTGEEIAVIDINGSNYFSPHPIPILTTMEQLTGFLHERKITHAIVKKGAFKTLSDLPADQFNVHVLKIIGYNYLLNIESRIHS